MLSLVISSATAEDSLDLGALLDGNEGVQAIAGLTGAGLPPVSVQWSEGAGDGATYRGKRVLPRDIDVPLFVSSQTRAGLRSIVKRLSRILADECTLTLTDSVSGEWTLNVVRVGGGDFIYGPDTDGEHDLMFVVTLRAGQPFWTSTTANQLSSNLLPNPSFESGTSGWFANYGSFTTSTTAPLTGSQVGRFTATSATVWQFAGTGLIPATPGTTYTGSMFLKMRGELAGVDFQILWYDGSTFLDLGATATYASPSMSTASYVRVHVTGTAPPNANNMQIRVTLTRAVAVGNGFDIDAAMINEGGFVTYNEPYSVAFPFAMYNNGTAAAPVQWEVRGPGKNLTIDYVDGSLQWNGTLANGESLFIDAESGTVVDNNGTNRYAELGPAPRFPYIRSQSTHQFNVGWQQIPPSVLRTNLCVNPNAKVNTTSWTIVGGALAASGGFRVTPSAKVVTLSHANVSVTAGYTYTFSATMASYGNMQNMRVRLGWYSAGGALLTTTERIWYSGLRVSVTGTAPDGASYAVPTFWAQYNAATGNADFTVKQVLIEWSSSAQFYFDGDTADTSTINYAWTGASGNSTSTLTVTPDRSTALVKAAFHERDWMVI